MDELTAAKLLQQHRVDRSFDSRPADEVLISMVEKGYLPGSLLNQSVEITQVTPEDISQHAV